MKMSDLVARKIQWKTRDDAISGFTKFKQEDSNVVSLGPQMIKVYSLDFTSGNAMFLQ